MPALMNPLDLETLAILKEDVFGTVAHCRLDGEPVVCRDYAAARGGVARWIARRLARREARALECLAHLAGKRVPRLVHFGTGRCIRTYIDGHSLKALPQTDPAYYAKGLSLLRDVHAAGVVHNDLEKPENWLVTPDGDPAIVDFQVALSFNDRRTWLFRLGAGEDVRHLYKNKRRYCAAPLTDEERSVVERKSLAARLHARVVKPVYRLITRRLLGTSDRARSHYSR